MPGSDTSTASGKIDDRQRGTSREAVPKKQRALFWRDELEEAKPPATPKAAIPSKRWLTDEEHQKLLAQSVDEFIEAKYDINRSEKKGALSKIVSLEYKDGVTIDLSIDDILDDDVVPVDPRLPFFYLGPGNRVFPRVLARATTPRLWQVKREVLIVMSEFAELIINMSIVVIDIFIFSPPFTLHPMDRPVQRGKSRARLFLSDAERARIRAKQEAEAAEEARLAVARAKRPPPPPFVIGPDGKQIPPDHHGRVYHGTKISPQKVLDEGGLPPKGDNRNLLDHKNQKGDTALRGATHQIVEGVPESEKGAAFWAADETGTGWVCEIEGRPVYDLETHLYGRVRDPVDPMRPFKSEPHRGELELVIDAEVPLENIREMYEVRITKRFDAPPKVSVKPVGLQRMIQAREADRIARTSGR
jgi:hypothetical protein